MKISIFLFILFTLSSLSHAYATALLSPEDQSKINEAITWCETNDGPCKNNCIHLMSKVSMAVKVAEFLIYGELEETSPKKH